MTTTRSTLPTLTEVIQLTPGEAVPTEPLPLAPESVPLDSMAPRAAKPAEGLLRLSMLGPEEAARIVDAVVARLQPQLETWVRDQIGQALRESVEAAVRDAVRTQVDAAAADVARRLRTELPTLARAALDAVRPDGFES
jgi:hypothetical protein